MPLKTPALAAPALAFVLAVTAATPAHAEPTKEQCVDAYKKNQQLRRDGALREAIKQLLVCARDPCPPLLQTDCLEWLRDATARLPSVVFKAHSDTAADLSDVSITMDGAPLLAHLDGRSVDVDPGLHTFVLAHVGSPWVERKLVIAEGEKGRIVDVVFTSPAPTRATSEQGATVSRPTPWTVYALGGLGITALGMGAAFGTIGLSGRSDLASCRGSHCADDRDAVAQKFRVADLSFLVGALSLAAATVVYLTRPPSSAP